MTENTSSNDLIHLAFAQTSVALAVLAPQRDGRGQVVDFEWIHANRATQSLITGTEPGAVLSQSLPPPALPPVMAMLTSQVQPEQEPRARSRVQFSVRTAEGMRWLRCSATPSGDGVVVSFVDVTSERALRQESGILTSIYEQAPFAACFIGGEPAEFDFANEGFADLCGVGPLLGRRVEDVAKEPGAPQEILKLLLSVQASRRKGAIPEFEVLTKNGSKRYLRIVAQPVEETPGEATMVQLIAADVTALVESRVQAEALAEELAAAKSSLEESSRSKDEFLAMLGHELRNPLSALRHASVVLSDVGAGDEARSVVAIIDRQTKQMGRLVDDLLDVGRIAQGKFDFRAERVDMRQIVSFSLDDLEAGHLATQGIHADLAEGPLWVDGDSARLLQACQNILNNAVKYTPEDGCIGVELTHDADWITLRVQDSGVGLDPSFKEKLFHPFEQAPQDLSRSQGGLGLGLALTSQIVSHHRGSIDAESPGRGQGATFTIRIPKGADAPALPTPVPPGPRRRIRFLIVEDNRDAAELLELLLASRGHDVAVCYSGDRAFEAALGHHPDVILCDLGLPGLSGFEVAEKIKAEPRLESAVLVALTGYGRSEDIERCEQAGFDGHLTKPADIDEILRLLTDMGAMDAK